MNDSDLVKKQRKKNSIISLRVLSKKVLQLNMWFVMVGVLVLAVASITTFLVGLIRKIFIGMSFIFRKILMQSFVKSWR